MNWPGRACHQRDTDGRVALHRQTENIEKQTGSRVSMQILLTVDVELSPMRHKLHPTDLATNIRGAYYGGRAERWGLRDQLDALQRHGLKAVFFVEALSVTVTGLDHLAKVCALINGYGQEIQLHTHPEWFSFTSGDAEPLTTHICMLNLPL